jgi:capsular polysaccharide biosynthesis protein
VDISADDLRPAFAADSARSVFVVYFGWDNEAELEQIAAATIEVLQTRNQQYFPQFASAPAQIVPLDEIDIVRTAPPLTTRLSPFIRVFIGLAAGVGLALLAEYLDDSVRSKDDLTALGLEVIGVIPRH